MNTGTLDEISRKLIINIEVFKVTLQTAFRAKSIFNSNKEDIENLIDIHTMIGGYGTGRRVGLEVLNKSAVVLITACWEAFIEDLCEEAFDFLLNNCTEYNQVPSKVRLLASERLRSSQDKREVWDLAADGWKGVLLRHKSDTLKKYIGNLNTPKSVNVKNIYAEVFGIEDITKEWKRHKQSSNKACDRLDKFIETRGAIAHRTSAEKTIQKRYVESHLDFIKHLVDKTEDAVRSHLKHALGLN
ncbi:MAE_28990/MAE_18760 family HEPN-like nuclease [Saccharibacillus sp. CPCC 101409]|uniref:HEPN domain-containing protein n=1 Tax=Saccharibacillus sp. CPCC 101409 TaxID=3058041 RepID=UPI00267179AE|nr:MAE_28990/MAE_18760 family HEPN-like nuclease [Saccharibacillus sp. CPCC 101409]MDO3413398.1 MAE_28990/MAE_18760 family HEPN-like nuclease [Saccharibacillus sp. CPCC 101409]